MDTQEGGFPPPLPAPMPPPPIPPLLPHGAEDGPPPRRTKVYTISGIVVAVVVAVAVRAVFVSLSGGTPKSASAKPASDFSDTTLDTRADAAMNEARGIVEQPPLPAGAENLFAKTSPAVVRIEVRDAQFRVIAH